MPKENSFVDELSHVIPQLTQSVHTAVDAIIDISRTCTPHYRTAVILIGLCLARRIIDYQLQNNLPPDSDHDKIAGQIFDLATFSRVRFVTGEGEIMSLSPSADDPS